MDLTKLKAATLKYLGMLRKPKVFAAVISLVAGILIKEGVIAIPIEEINNYAGLILEIGGGIGIFINPEA